MTPLVMARVFSAQQLKNKKTAFTLALTVFLALITTTLAANANTKEVGKVGVPALAQPVPAPKPPVAQAAVKVDPTRPGKAPAGSWLSAENMTNAAIIVRVGQDLGLPRRAWEIAVATAMQESTLHNYGNLGANNDHDSLGLFQQRPSTGWGTPAQIQDPRYSAKAFYNALQRVPNWQKMRLTDAAQTVQVSAFPDAYQKHEGIAKRVIDSLLSAAAKP